MTIFRSAFPFALAVFVLGSSPTALALTTSTTLGPTSNQAGAYTVTFGVSDINNDSFASLSLPSGTEGGVSYSYTGGALYNYDSSTTTFPGGISARPVGSTGNYWSIGTRPVEQNGPGIVSFDSGVSYYGFLWGSPDGDGWNTVDFYDGDQLLGSFDGSAVLFPPDGDQTFSAYFNVFAGAGETITKVSFSANRNAFETDNHAFIAAVPEPEIYAMMGVGIGIMGWVTRRNKRKQALVA